MLVLSEVLDYVEFKCACCLLNAAAMDTLSNAEAIHVSTVLEDCIDQLIILGRIMPVPYQKRPDAEQVC